jgi:hypothetical protein
MRKNMSQRPIQCFEEGAEKVYYDQLDNVVSTCSWGNHAAIGTGSAFEIHWNDPNQVQRPFYLPMQLVFAAHNHILPFALNLLIIYRQQAMKILEAMVYMTFLQQ